MSKPEFKNTITPTIKNKIVNLIPTLVRTIPPSRLLRGDITATTALCNGPLMPPIIMSKNPGVLCRQSGGLS